MKDNTITSVGLILAVVTWIFYYNINWVEVQSVLWLIAHFVIRILCTRWVYYGPAKRQNRNMSFWAIITMIAPSISMIIIGQLKKLKEPRFVG